MYLMPVFAMAMAMIGILLKTTLRLALGVVFMGGVVGMGLSWAIMEVVTEGVTTLGLIVVGTSALALASLGYSAGGFYRRKVGDPQEVRQPVREPVLELEGEAEPFPWFGPTTTLVATIIIITGLVVLVVRITWGAPTEVWSGLTWGDYALVITGGVIASVLIWTGAWAGVEGIRRRRENRLALEEAEQEAEESAEGRRLGAFAQAADAEEGTVRVPPAVRRAEEPETSRPRWEPTHATEEEEADDDDTDQFSGVVRPTLSGPVPRTAARPLYTDPRVRRAPERDPEEEGDDEEESSPEQPPAALVNQPSRWMAVLGVVGAGLILAVAVLLGLLFWPSSEPTEQELRMAHAGQVQAEETLGLVMKTDPGLSKLCPQGWDDNCLRTLRSKGVAYPPCVEVKADHIQALGATWMVSLDDRCRVETIRQNRIRLEKASSQPLRLEQVFPGTAKSDPVPPTPAPEDTPVELP